MNEHLIVVTQSYNTYADREDIIRGNSAILKCKIPSFVSDFLDVVAWHDDIGNVYSLEKNAFGITRLTLPFYIL